MEPLRKKRKEKGDASCLTLENFHLWSQNEKTARDIAKEYDLCVDSVLKTRIKLGAPKLRHPRDLKKEDEEKIARLYNDGLTSRKIGKLLGLTEGIVYNSLKRNSIEKRSVHDSSYLKRQTNSNYFEKIDSEEKAYILGFLYADGYLYKRSNRVTITLANKDRYMIELFREKLSPEAPIYNVADNTCSRINFHSKKMFADLVDKGLHQNKSFSIKFPSFNTIQESLFHHFVRGYFDGDGGVTIFFPKNKKKPHTSYNFVGNEEFIRTLDTFLSERIFGHRTILSKKNSPRCFSASCGSKQGVKEFYLYLYKDATIFLNRKKEKFETIFKLRDINI